MRSLLLAVLCLPGGADLLSPAERRNVEGVVAAVIAAGFPDAAMAVVHFGKLSVSATIDSAKETPPLPTEASRTQMTVPNSTKVTYGYEFEGLHVKLADGTWLISLAYRYKPGPGDQVSTADAPPIDLAGLTAAAAKAYPFDAEKDAGKWLDGVAPAARTRAAAEMTAYVPVTRHLKLGPDALAPAAVLLHRAGWPDAAGLALSMADQRARSYWQLRPWKTGEPAFDPTGSYPKAKDEEEAWKKATPQPPAETPDAALRHALYRWCRAQIMGDDSLLPPAVAAACCKAVLDAKDPQGNGARADAMLAGSKLPISPAENATLAERLQSWEARPRRPKMSVSGNTAKGNSVTMSTGFFAPVPAYQPRKEDLDALVALLGDERPSRFWDFAGPRTLGDNAWRALASLLEADPRTLSALPVDKPWTAAERTSEAAAFQKWWKEHRKDRVGK
ncbi:MAG TPA: hypothetical protein VKW04_16955 [Planctomycetota bacterium]|nr:hypothetical protein [Planctomycetota bacterium]